MKRSFFLFLVIGLSAVISSAQVPYHVVFDLTSSDTLNHKSVIRWLEQIIEMKPDAQLEVVFYGKSLDMVVKDRSKFAPQIHDLSANKNISFKVCAVAMKNNDIDESMLLP